jgi:SAM-dependent methyltransferase
MGRQECLPSCNWTGYPFPNPNTGGGKSSMAMIARECPLCGSADRSREYAEAAYDPGRLDRFAFASRKLPEYMHYRLLLCAGCELLYASPVPELEALAEQYRAAAYDSSLEARYAARTYAGLLRRILGRLPDRAGALDIGAGDGAFLRELLALGFTDVCGAEPSAAPIAAADASVRPLLRHGPFQASDYQDRTLSLITCFQTLEHVPDPLGLCRDALGLLKPGGAMLCVVHNRRALSARLLGRRSPIFDIEHLQLFSRPSARRLLASAGFCDVHIRTVVNRYPLSYWTRLFPMPGGLKRGMIAAMNRTGIGRLSIPFPAGNMAVYGFVKKNGSRVCKVSV